MFASLKESATAAGGNMREGMSRATDSVKTGLGIPSGEASREGESDAQSEASSMVDEVAEYCPKMTYQQVGWDPVDRLTLRLYRNYAYELPRTIFRELPGSP